MIRWTIRIFWLGLFAVSIASTASAAMAEPQAHELYANANAWFRDANGATASNPAKAKALYKEAADAYARLIRESDLPPGALHYNIGNAYFRLGDTARAILHYRLATRFLPDDPDALRNLALARSRRIDKLDPPEDTRVLRAALFWHYDWSTRTRAILFGLLALLFWGGLSVRLFAPTRIGRVPLVVAGLAAAGLLGSLLVERQANAAEIGVVTAAEVVARQGDGEAFAPSFKTPLHAGAEFTVRERRGDWLRAELPGGENCWLSISTIETSLAGRR